MIGYWKYLPKSADYGVTTWLLLTNWGCKDLPFSYALCFESALILYDALLNLAHNIERALLLLLV